VSATEVDCRGGSGLPAIREEGVWWAEDDVWGEDGAALRSLPVEGRSPVDRLSLTLG